MIEVQRLTKHYGPITAIRDVSFSVAPGEIVGFLGPNGAGKSTTMRILACFMPASSGTAQVAGHDVFRESLEVRRRIGYLPESVPLYGDLRVAPYLDFVAEVKGVGRAERRRRVAEVMERCLITDVQHRLIGRLSKGYRQRVGLAQAILGDPEVLILDEPTIGLDPKQITEIRSPIKSFAGRHTVILSTHTLPEVSMVCGWGRRSRRSSSAWWRASRRERSRAREDLADLQEGDAALLHVAGRVRRRGDLRADRGLLLLQHLRLLHARVHAVDDEPGDGPRAERDRQRHASAVLEHQRHPPPADAARDHAAVRRGAALGHDRAPTHVPGAGRRRPGGEVSRRARPVRAHADAHAPLPGDRRRLRAARMGTGRDRLRRAPPDGQHVHRRRPLRLVADREPDRRLDHDLRHPLDPLDHRVERGLRRRRVGQGAPAPLHPRAQRQLRQGGPRHEGRPVLRELHRARAVSHAPLPRSAPVEGMIRRIVDWGGSLGLAALAAGVALPFVWPGQAHYRGFLLVAGALLVVAALLARIEDYRGLLGRRTTRYGVNAAVMILLVLGVTGLVQALAAQHSWRYDLTENKRFSLSPQTIQLLRTLPTDVSAIGFFRSDQPGKRVAEDLFKQYARYASADRFTWRVVDPDREPALARRYGIEAYGTVVLETKTKSEKILDAEEEKLTNGLVKVTREGKRVVYVVQGHGEHELTNSDRPGFSEAKAALERTNYTVKPLTLAREGKIADDAAVVILAGPRTELLQPEFDALDVYIGRGGKVLTMVDPFQSEGLRKYLAKYGFVLDNDLVVESHPIGRLFGIGPEVPIVQQYGAHAITREMSGVSTLFPLTRSLSAAAPMPKGVS